VRRRGVAQGHYDSWQTCEENDWQWDRIGYEEVAEVSVEIDRNVRWNPFRCAQNVEVDDLPT
jgi:hypothetical protein